MRKTPFLFFFALLSILAFAPAYGQIKCVDAEGEAAIVNNDRPSAKMEAIARAKWQAIEQTVGVDVKAGSFVSNFTLVEDVMKTQVGGTVREYTVLSEDEKKDVLTVRIKACVEPKKAQEAISSELALNNGVAVFIPARKPQAERGGSVYEETNILSENLIGKLTDQNYKVVDVAPTQAADAAEIERAVKSGSTLAVRSMFYKFLSNVVIIGKTDYTISTKKGEDIGYGLSMPFNNVTVRLAYRMVARNNKTGAMEILTAGTEQGKGIRNNVEDAAAEALKDVAEKVTPKILDKLSQYIKGNVKKIRIQIAGVGDIDTNIEIKGILQNIVWVSEVEEKEMGAFIVSYPENSIYLANSIKQKGNFTITNFTPYSLTIGYQK
ncbi:MAG: flagellar assembly protein T N-terminal domain-containing protein [Syntrophales bacterium]|jgi:hypothetical protein|nr:flagellar assembly protein T N-terminal domain-containing protein [Syntrophales bacterium]